MLIRFPCHTRHLVFKLHLKSYNTVHTFYDEMFQYLQIFLLWLLISNIAAQGNILDVDLGCNMFVEYMNTSLSIPNTPIDANSKFSWKLKFRLFCFIFLMAGDMLILDK